MKAIQLEGTWKLPTVILDRDKGHFEISGKSLPEDSKVFFEPILKWIDDYKVSPNKKTDFTFKLDYFNTSSSMMIFAILLKLKSMLEEGNAVLVKWYSSEEDIKEAGIDYSEAIDLPFELIELD